MSKSGPREVRREGPFAGPPPTPGPPLAPGGGEDAPSGLELAGGSFSVPFPSPGRTDSPCSPVIFNMKLESVKIFLGSDLEAGGQPKRSEPLSTLRRLEDYSRRSTHPCLRCCALLQCACVGWGVGAPSLAGWPRTPLRRDPPVPWNSSGPGPHLPGTQKRRFLPVRWRREETGRGITVHFKRGGKKSWGDFPEGVNTEATCRGVSSAGRISSRFVGVQKRDAQRIPGT